MPRTRFVRAWMLMSVASVVVGASAVSGPASAQTVTDPGVRGGAAGAGGPLPGLGPDEVSFFNAARTIFQEVDSVSGTITGEPGAGLGPRFNMNSCSACHLQPAVGGSSPSPNTQPQIAVDAGAT